MATEVRRRVGTTFEHSTFTGAIGEITIDTDKNTVVVHNGVTVGGHPLAKEDLSNVDVQIIANFVTPSSIGAATATQGDKADNSVQLDGVGVITETMLDANTKLKLNNTPLNKFDAVTAPTAQDDGANTATNGKFTTGSLWYNTVTHKLYQCIDATTNTAMWHQINLQLSDLGTAATKNITDFATAGAGTLAITALQPNDKISKLNNDLNYILSVNGKSGPDPILTAIDISGISTVGKTGAWEDLINVPPIFSDLGEFVFDDLPAATDPVALNKWAVITNHPSYPGKRIIARSNGTTWNYVAEEGAVL
jgi:hypothetical protein